MHFTWASPVAQLVKNLPAMRETWVWSLGWEDPLEKETATHSSILGWRVSWTEEPGGLPSIVSRRMGHSWARTQEKAEGSFLPSPLSIMWRHMITALGLLGTAGVLTKSNLPAPSVWISVSRNVRNQCLMFKSPMYGNLLWQLELGILGNITVTLINKVE